MISKVPKRNLCLTTLGSLFCYIKGYSWQFWNTALPSLFFILLQSWHGANTIALPCLCKKLRWCIPLFLNLFFYILISALAARWRVSSTFAGWAQWKIKEFQAKFLSFVKFVHWLALYRQCSFFFILFFFQSYACSSSSLFLNFHF